MSSVMFILASNFHNMTSKCFVHVVACFGRSTRCPRILCLPTRSQEVKAILQQSVQPSHLTEEATCPVLGRPEPGLLIPDLGLDRGVLHREPKCMSSSFWDSAVVTAAQRGVGPVKANLLELSVQTSSLLRRGCHRSATPESGYLFNCYRRLLKQESGAWLLGSLPGR